MAIKRINKQITNQRERKTSHFLNTLKNKIMKTLENLLTEQEEIFAQKLKELFISLDNIKSIDKGAFNTKMVKLKMSINIYDYQNK